MEYLSQKMDELLLKRYDENAETGVIQVVDENQEDEEFDTIKEPTKKSKADKKKQGNKKRGRTESVKQPQTKLTKFFKTKL